VHDAGPALKRLRRLEPAATCLRHVKSLFEHLLNGVQWRAYSPRVLHLMGVMATHVMVAAILRLGESGSQRS
jgi:hypothetical protein